MTALNSPPVEVSELVSTEGSPPALTTGGDLRPGRIKNLVGRTFGYLTVEGIDPQRAQKHIGWLCRCKCGKLISALGCNLTSGHTRSCGCARGVKNIELRQIDLVGRRFGRLLVLEQAAKSLQQPRVCWLCKCDCGRLKIIAGADLRSGNTNSCGCLRAETLRDKRRVLIAGRVFGRLTVVGLSTVQRPKAQWWRCQCSCGKTVNVPSSRLIFGTTKSCGCFKRDQLFKANYNPNLTDADRLRKRRGGLADANLSKLSKKVFVRDAHTCICCGDVGGRLEAHHIFSWAKHPDLRYDEANLVTLCAECHKTFHYLCGHDSDLDELEDYLWPFVPHNEEQ